MDINETEGNILIKKIISSGGIASSSISGLIGRAGDMPYNVSKHGINYVSENPVFFGENDYKLMYYNKKGKTIKYKNYEDN